MPDTETRPPTDQGQQTSQPNQAYGQGQNVQDPRSQQQIDSIFAGQINSIDSSLVTQGWQQYFALAQQTIAAAQRVSDLSMLNLQRQQIVSECVQQVTQHLVRNPQLLQSVAQQAASQAASQLAQQRR